MNYTIVICDDDEEILEVIRIVLEEKGYNVVAVSEPQRIYDTIQKTRPHLILLDLWMPIINGNEIIQKLKEDEVTNSIPIIVVSANKDTESIAAATGANGFLCKPFDIKDLEDIVEKNLALQAGIPC